MGLDYVGTFQHRRKAAGGMTTRLEPSKDALQSYTKAELIEYALHLQKVVKELDEEIKDLTEEL